MQSDMCLLAALTRMGLVSLLTRAFTMRVRIGKMLKFLVAFKTEIIQLKGTTIKPQ